MSTQFNVLENDIARIKEMPVTHEAVQSIQKVLDRLLVVIRDQDAKIAILEKAMKR